MFDNLHPWLHEKALKSTKYYLFSGGSTVLKTDLFGKNALKNALGCIILLEFA
jgi:hypothetical protein